MNSNHKARRLALQGLCALDVQGQAALDLVQAFLKESHESLDTIVRARDMLAGTLAARDEIDAMLASQSRHWNLSRMALVDRNILRLSVWELRCAAAPASVIINEAVRLAQEFASTESPGFVNGVLDAVAQRLAASKPDKGAQDAGEAGDAKDVAQEVETVDDEADDAPADAPTDAPEQDD